VFNENAFLGYGKAQVVMSDPFLSVIEKSNNEINGIQMKLRLNLCVTITFITLYISQTYL